MPYNGPAIKGVSVAERVKAGAVKLNWGNVPAHSQGRAFKNCPVGNFSEGAGLRGGTNHGAFFAIQLQVFRVLRTFAMTELASVMVSRRAPYERSEVGGTSLIEATNLSQFTNLVAGTGAVSRNKMSRRQ
jgi:hypothetical protein